MRFLATVCVVFALLWACTGELIGPDGQPTTEQNVVTEANALIESWREKIASLEANQDIRPLTPTEAGSLAKLKAQLAGVESYMKMATTPEGGIDAGAAVTGGAMLLPPPWNIPIAVLGGGIVEWFRSRKKRKSFDNLVGAINKAKAREPELATALDAAGPVLRASMGEYTAREVDRVRSEKLNIIRDW